MPTLRRFLPTQPSTSTNSAPLPRPRSIGRLGSPSLTKTETAPLRPILLSRTVTRSLGVLETFLMAMTVPHPCPPLALLPCLTVHLPVFLLAAAECHLRLLPARVRLVVPLLLRPVALKAMRMGVSFLLFPRPPPLWLASSLLSPRSCRTLTFQRS